MCVGILLPVTAAMCCVPKPNLARCNLPLHPSAAIVSSGSQLTSHPKARASAGPAPLNAMMARHLVLKNLSLAAAVRLSGCIVPATG